MTPNFNGSNLPIERHRLVDWIRKQDPSYCIHKLHLIIKDRNHLRVKDGKTFTSKGTHKTSHVAILISDNIGFEQQLSRRDRRNTT